MRLPTSISVRLQNLRIDLPEQETSAHAFPPRESSSNYTWFQTSSEAQWVRAKTWDAISSTMVATNLSILCFWQMAILLYVQYNLKLSLDTPSDELCQFVAHHAHGYSLTISLLRRYTVNVIRNSRPSSFPKTHDVASSVSLLSNMTLDDISKRTERPQAKTFWTKLFPLRIYSPNAWL